MGGSSTVGTAKREGINPSDERNAILKTAQQGLRQADKRRKQRASSERLFFGELVIDFDGRSF